MEGSCSSSSNDNISVADNNTVTFNALPDETYSNCTVRVTSNGVASEDLSVSSFTIDTTVLALSSLTISSNNDNTTMAKVGDTIILAITAAEDIRTPSVSIAGQSVSPSRLSGYTGWRATKTMLDNNTEGSVSLSISFSDTLGNAGIVVDNTTDGSAVQFDKTTPTLAETTLVPSLTNDNSTQYTFSSTEEGTITIGGDCSSDNDTAVADNMTVSFAALPDGNL